MHSKTFMASDFKAEPYLTNDQLIAVDIRGPDGKPRRLLAWEALALADNLRRAVLKGDELLTRKTQGVTTHG
jgi:hypothetical protein